MRILSKIKKNYGDISSILKNDYFHSINNIISITFDGSNLYILGDFVYVYNYDNNSITKIPNIKLNNPKKIEYYNNHLYILDNNLYDYDLQTQQYNQIISGSVNQFINTNEFIIYDKNGYIYRFNKNNKANGRITKLVGGLVDIVSDNLNLFLCYDTYVQKYNYNTSFTSNITNNLSNIKSMCYDGLLIYLRSETDDILKIYTKNGLEYTEPKLNNITKFQDIFYDGNYVYYRENNHVYRFDENVVYYNYNIKNVEKIKNFNLSGTVSLKDSNLIISNGHQIEYFDVSYFSNIVDYGYHETKKYIINNSNVFTISNSIKEIIYPNVNPIQIINNTDSVYILDNNCVYYLKISDPLSNVIPIISSNISSNIIDMVLSDKLYILKDNQTIDVYNTNKYTKTYLNIDAIKICVPTPQKDIYYISIDNKIKKYSNGTSSIVLENRGICVDEQLLYFYKNRLINTYKKNNSGLTQLDENIYYGDNNRVYCLNNNGITDDLGISNVAINGLTHDTSNIIVCTRNNVQKFDPFEAHIKMDVISQNLNNPFEAILVDNFYYITDTFNHQIVKVNKNTLKSTVIITGLNYPRGIEYRNGYLYVVDSGLDKIIKINIITNTKTDFSQTISGIVDFCFDKDILYVTSLLQNAIFKIETGNNNTLTTYFDIEKPYYIDNEINFLVSGDYSITMSTLSYAELKDLVKVTSIRINKLVANNQLYNINIKFKKWIDNEINKASNEKNMNRRNDMLLNIEKLLLTMNSSMDYTDAADATHVTNLENFKSRSFLIMNSFVNMFKNVSRHTNKK